MLLQYGTWELHCGTPYAYVMENMYVSSESAEIWIVGGEVMNLYVTDYLLAHTE